MLTLNPSNYPSPEQIMKNPVDFREDTLEAVREWKKEYFDNMWKDLSNDHRLMRLHTLVAKLSSVYGVSPSVERYDDHYAFNPSRNLISFDAAHPSIISTLHEFRHAINGPDETSACRWSVHLFKQCFPKQFDQLMFKPGTHLLVKKPS
jgi:hypothetical protein